MSLAEHLLLFLSRRPSTSDYSIGNEHWTHDNALSLLRTTFPDYIHNIRGKEILDFGCGSGWQVIALARNGAKYVVGIDSDHKALKRAQESAEQLGLATQVHFTRNLDASLKERFDIVFSQNSMEHFDHPLTLLGQMSLALKPDGVILMTFACPWFAPYGSHMHFFTKLPWVNILFSEKTVMNVRKHFRTDGATRYDDVEGGLNKMTIAKFERLLRQSNLHILQRRYDCVRGVNFFREIPLLRELLINRVTCVLKRRSRTLRK